MAMYLILSRLSPNAFGDLKEFKKLAEDISGEIKKECPGAT
jgi:hypothetical protein